MIEFFSPSWAVVSARVEEELKSLRNKLEAPTTDWPQTQVLRGEIRALKRLLGLPDEIAAARQSSNAPPNPFGGDGT